jgi:uncharacterized protein YuzE
MERMALRAISLSELELALSDDPSYRDKTGAEIYVKKLKDYSLIVIVHKIDDILKVITVYKARKVDKLIRNKLKKRFTREAKMKKERPPLRAHYDPETDILYLHFMDGTAEEILEAGENVIVELDKKGRIMGIEVWGASKKGVLKELRKVVASAR